MSYQANEAEIAAVTLLSADRRMEYFVNKIADWEEVWSVADQQGWTLMGTKEETELVPVWPAQAFAKACCIGAWDDCEPKAISLSDWINKWVPGILSDGRAIAVFPTPHDLGMVVEADELEERIKRATLPYE